MMGSETGAKWFAIILVYFAVMIFIVGLVNTTMGVSVGTEVNSTGTYCGSPRNIYTPFEGDPKSQEGLGGIWENYYESHIDCSLSAGVLSQSSCLTIEGCSWEAKTFFWIPVGDDTCVGQMNYSFINDTSQVGLLGRGISDYDLNGEDSKFICTHPAVYTNETLCGDLSCTWKYRDSISEFNSDNVEPKLGMLSGIWEVTKDLVSFSFDFGFDDSMVNWMLNFLIFWLPLICLGLSLYVMVRS